MVEGVYAHLGQLRHRSEVVEYRVEQHRSATLEDGTTGRTVDGQATGEAGALAIQQSGHESTGWTPHPLRGFGMRCASHPPFRWSAGPPVRRPGAPDAVAPSEARVRRPGRDAV
jgi:hypothetical protein